MKYLSAKIAVLAILILSSCSPITATSGNIISNAKFDEVKPYISNRAEILKYWGPPTVQSSFDSNTWYYMGETTEQRGVFAPKVVKRRIIRVKFHPSDNNTIIEIKDLNVNNAKDIKLVKRETPTAGKKFTVIQQFIGNLGKYNK